MWHVIRTLRGAEKVPRTEVRQRCQHENVADKQTENWRGSGSTLAAH